MEQPWPLSIGKMLKCACVIKKSALTKNTNKCGTYRKFLNCIVYYEGMHAHGYNNNNNMCILMHKIIFKSKLFWQLQTNEKT